MNHRLLNAVKIPNRNIQSMPDSLLENLEKALRAETHLNLTGLSGSTRSFLITALFEYLSVPLIAVLATERESEDFHRDCTSFCGHARILQYPAWRILTADFFTVQREIELTRIRVLSALLSGQPCLVVTSLPALVQKIIPKDVFVAYNRILSLGDALERDEIIGKFLAGGYERKTLVEQHGEFSIRGHILDLYPPDAANPFRIELVGDEIESIREFDPFSQRSIREVLDCRVTPVRDLVLTNRRRERAIGAIRRRANELGLPGQVREHLKDVIDNQLLSSLNPLYLSLFYEQDTDTSLSPNARKENMACLFDYCPDQTLLFLDDESAMERSFLDRENSVQRLLLQAEESNTFFVEPDMFQYTMADIRTRFTMFRRIFSLALQPTKKPASEDNPNRPSVITFRTEGAGPARKTHPAATEGLLSPLADTVRRGLFAGRLVVFMCSSTEGIQRMSHLLSGYGLDATHADGGADLLQMVRLHEGAGRLILMEGKVATGFQFPEMNLILFSEEEIFGRKQAKRASRSNREGYFLKSFGDLSEGDHIVHKEHGIGVYRGLQKMAVANTINDYLLIEYAEQDRLYIPVERLDQIQRYMGPEGYTPRVDRLGSTSWESVKERVKKSIREVAEELVSIYAAREVIEREGFSPPDRLYDEFCAAFEYEETPDQGRAIEDIHEDMSREKPMDRLICGDAGFGKTEVALRAAFRAAMDGRQVAVLVPTTVLAEQHYQTFHRRLQDYPLRIEVLNRLKTKKEQSEIVAAANRGNVDILIGTHRILQKDLTFRNLGLVIVDEEQRFGVAHKERLKKIRTLVDVLTLSATPIPRTLHLSLVGIRDLSIINTPPEDRRPIQTYVIEFNEETIREAIRRELSRNGQVFFLHDRIQSIFTMARLLAGLVPEARIGVVHGRMKPAEIEDAMVRFVRGDHQVLVCTTIIASGVDIPSANTIIINRADRLGLSQLYQIRGRVGRGREEAYAYLLIPKGAMLSRDAQKRLQTLIDFSEPGSGFRIASNDLEIRGTGNLLGTSQSGHVSAVGYELYTELMEQTIRELKGEPLTREEIRPEIHLGFPAFIPEEYMADEHQRLLMYKRMSLLQTEEEIEAIRNELQDCFGYIPPEVSTLLDLIRLRHLLEKIKGRRMTGDARQLMIHLSPDSPVDPAKILHLAQTKLQGTKLTPELKLYIPLATPHIGDRLRFAEEILRILLEQPDAP